MRARNVKPALFKNEVLGCADPLLTLLFVGLWCEADRDGRLEDRPLRLRAEIFPYRDNAPVDEMLNWLTDNAFIARYQTNDGLRVIQVLKFSEHQRPHSNEAQSVLPAMDQSKHHQGKKRLPPRRAALRSDSLFSDSGSLIPDPLNLDSRSGTVDKFDAGKVEGLDARAWADWIEYRAKRKPAVKSASMPALAKKMVALGAGQRAAVDHSIANGYQGLVAPKGNGHLAPPAVAPAAAAPVVGGVVPTWANGRDSATWAEARSLAQAIGFRDPWPQESASAYQTQVKFEAQKAPSMNVLERIGLRRGG